MSSLQTTLDAYWVTTEYDLRYFWQHCLGLLNRLKRSVSGLVLSNIISGLVVMQLIYILPFSQMLAFSTSTPKVYGLAAPLAKTTFAVPAPPAPAPAAVVVPVKASDLQSTVNNWVIAHPGQYGVMIQDISGSKGTAAFNADKQFVSASIYKLYVAYAVYTKLATGEFSKDSLTSTGASVDSCLSVMIVRSDNPCAHALLDKVGARTAETLVHQRGFTSTFLATKSSFITTARDTTELLKALNAGTLIRSDYQGELLDNMSRQIYRSGIPAANPGIRVADKVGFIDSYNHDAGLVYGPKGTYVIVVLTSGSSFANIAGLSRQIATIMNR